MYSSFINTIFYVIASSGFAETIILNWLFCMHLTLLLTQFIANLNSVIGLFVDVSKAFDSIDYTVLLDKFFMLGFRGNCHSWLSSYLSNRFQYIEIAGTKSNMHKLSKGVPQGSILRPHLFNSI